MEALITVSTIFYSISFLLYLAALYYIRKIRLFTQGFKEVWIYIFFGIICLILLMVVNLVFIMINQDNVSITRNLFISILHLIASFFFSYGYFKLSEIFNEVSHKKVFLYDVKKQFNNISTDKPKENFI